MSSALEIPNSSTGRRYLTVVGGFLGAGKTTLIRGMIANSSQRIGVVVNEFGEIPLDHRIIYQADNRSVVVAGGCACCERREGLVAALHDLISAEQGGFRLRADEVIVETSGVADPAPIAFSVRDDPVLRHHFSLSKIIIVVDPQVGIDVLNTYGEARKQVSVADELIITKTDVVGAEQCRELELRLREFNPWAPIFLAADGERKMLRNPGKDGRPSFPTALEQGLHSSGSSEFSSLHLTWHGETDWGVFVAWLSLLLHAHGDRVLRGKGIINVRGIGEVAVHTVQHVVHPPEHLEHTTFAAQSEKSGVSDFVFVFQGLQPELVKHSFESFNSAFRRELKLIAER